MSESFFPEWTFEVTKAKSFGLLPTDGVAPLSCVSFGPNRIAFGSSKLLSIFYSNLDSPEVKSIKPKFDSETIISMEWQTKEPYNLLVVFTKNIIIINTNDNEITAQVGASDPNLNYIDAHWTTNGDILALSEKNQISFYDSNLQNTRQINSLTTGDSFCCELDGDKLYIGQHRKILIFDVSNDQEVKQIGSIVAHPHDITRIRMLNGDRFIVTTDEGSVIWDKNELVPILNIKAASSMFVADPAGELGIEVSPSKKKQTFFKIVRGKRSEILKEVKFGDDIEAITAADWYCREDGEKFLALCAHSQRDICCALIVKITRKISTSE